MIISVYNHYKQRVYTNCNWISISTTFGRTCRSLNTQGSGVRVLGGGWKGSRPQVKRVCTGSNRISLGCTIGIGIVPSSSFSIRCRFGLTLCIGSMDGQVSTNLISWFYICVVRRTSAIRSKFCIALDHRSCLNGGSDSLVWLWSSTDMGLELLLELARINASIRNTPGPELASGYTLDSIEYRTQYTSLGTFSFPRT